MVAVGGISDGAPQAVNSNSSITTIPNLIVHPRGGGAPGAEWS